MGLTFHRTWPIPACPHADPPSHNLEISSPFAKLPEIDRVKRLTSENASSHLCSIREFFSPHTEISCREGVQDRLGSPS